jgi:hypothetical protein
MPQLPANWYTSRNAPTNRITYHSCSAVESVFFVSTIFFASYKETNRMLSRSVRGLSKVAARSVGAKPMTGAFVGAQRSMVTLAEKEKGEEARYFASKDAAATNEMKAAMEKILEQDDDSEQKQELIEVLGKCCNQF